MTAQLVNARVEEIARELNRIQMEKKDYIVDSRNIRATVINAPYTIPEISKKRVALRFTDTDSNEMSYQPTRWAHSQISAKLKIPHKYYERMMLEKPELCVENINAWMPKGNGRCIRILDGEIRAFVSSRFKFLENYDLFTKLLTYFKEYKDKGNNVEFQRSDLTETRMYLKILLPDLKIDMSKSHDGTDIWQQGIIAKNSEVGAGAFEVSLFGYRVVCSNGMIGTSKIKKIHIGKELDDGEINWRAKTRQLNSELIWSQVDDILNTSLDKDRFQGWLDKVHGLHEYKINNAVTAIDNVVAHFRVSDEMRNEMLAAFSGDSMYDVANSMTRAAQKLKNYDDQIQMEAMAGQLVTLPNYALDKMAGN